jgi:hypothetical protein
MEKIFETLLRQFPNPMFALLNADNCSIALKFLRHSSNFSIVQILQRLLLPHIPYSSSHEDLDKGPVAVCHWAQSKDFCVALVHTFLSNSEPDVTLHLNELLITVVQLSPVNAPFLEYLSSDEVLAPLCRGLQSSPAASHDSSTAVSTDETALGVDTAVATVLECLISKYYDSIPIMEEDGSWASQSPLSSSTDILKSREILQGKIDSICRHLYECIPNIVAHFEFSRENDEKFAQPKLGPRRLAFVKLINALLSVSNPAVDEQIHSRSVIKYLVDLMFSFPRHSILHFSLQRIILLIIEEFDRRKELFISLISEAFFIDRIMDYVRSKYSTSRSQHYPLLGHLYEIGKVLIYALNSAASKSQVDYDPTSSDGYVRKFRDTVSSYKDLEPWDAFVEEIFRDLIRRNTNAGSSLDNSMMSDKTTDYETPGKVDDDYNTSSAHYGNTQDWSEMHNRDHVDDDDDDLDDEDDEYRGPRGYQATNGSVGFDSTPDLFANFDDSKVFSDVSSGLSSTVFASSTILQDSFEGSGIRADFNGNSSNRVEDPFASGASLDPFADAPGSNDIF